MGTYKIKRIYDAPGPSDGVRVLVDRVWPRGISKEKARLDIWMREIAPSTELRKWFNHQPERFEEFKRRYFLELQGKEQQARLRELLALGSAPDATVTLLYAASDRVHNQAAALKEWLEQKAL